MALQGDLIEQAAGVQVDVQTAATERAQLVIHEAQKTSANGRLGRPV
jgi:hypothetical protein